MTGETLCFRCSRPIELGAVLAHGRLHCSFECATETGPVPWEAFVQRGSDVAPNPSFRNRVHVVTPRGHRLSLD